VDNACLIKVTGHAGGRMKLFDFSDHAVNSLKFWNGTLAMNGSTGQLNLYVNSEDSSCSGTSPVAIPTRVFDQGPTTCASTVSIETENGSAVTVPTGSDVTFMAPVVVLGPGFSAQGNFRATH